MPERSLIFPASEFRARIDRLQHQMALHGLEALLLTAPADIFYVSGFLTRFWESPARPWFVVVPAKAPPIAVIPEIGAELMGRTWMPECRTWPAPDPRDDGVSLLTDTLCAVTTPSGRIGTPMGPETHLRTPLGDYLRLVERIGPRKFVDGTNVVQRVREIKSELEITKIRQICDIAGRAFDRVGQFAAAGRLLSAVFRDMQIALLEEGADWVSYLAGAAAPGGYSDVISPASDRALAQGDVLMLDTGAVRDGYFCDFDRNFAVGATSADVAQAHAALWQATENVLQSIRPGQRACDVYAALTDALAQEGAQPAKGRFGHGLGLTLTEWPSLTALDETPLRAGMALTLEPSAVIGPGRILVHEENIVLRSEGAQLLSPRAPGEMPVLA